MLPSSLFFFLQVSWVLLPAVAIGYLVKTLSILLKRDINWKNCRLRSPSEEGKELQQLVNPAQVSLTVFVSSHSILDLPLLRASSNPQSSASLGFQ